MAAFDLRKEKLKQRHVVSFYVAPCYGEVNTRVHNDSSSTFGMVIKEIQMRRDLR